MSAPDRSAKLRSAAKSGLNMPWWRSRLALLSLLLLGILTLVGTLALLAQDEAGSHRETAERVLHDYAQMGVDVFLARAEQSFSREVLYALTPAMARSNSRPFPAPPASLASLRPKDDLGVSKVLSIFRYSLEAGDIVLSEDHRSEAGEEWLAEVAEAYALDDQASAGPRNPWLSLHEGSGYQRVLLLSMPPGRDGGEPIEVLGIEYDWSLLVEWLESAAVLGPPLPRFLAAKLAEPSAVCLQIRSAKGTILYAKGVPRGAMVTSYRNASRRFAELEIEVSIREEMASQLIIGGIPGSRAPLLAGLFAATVLLAIVAFWLLFRESELVRLRSGFIANVSHELRTPLAQIRLYAETLKLGRVRSEAEAKQSLEVIDLEARRLDGLVQNVLEFSRAERGIIRVAKRSVDLAVLLDDVVEGFRPIANGLDVELELELVDCPRIEVDPDSLRQIILNLLDNALKYGPRGQTIHVVLVNEDGMLQIHVDDQGPGVAVADRQRIWQRYWRSPIIDAAITGTGIGLCLVRALVEQNSGRVFVIDNPSGGARFVVEFDVPGAMP